jgi:hypothetical protein
MPELSVRSKSAQSSKLHILLYSKGRLVPETILPQTGFCIKSQIHVNLWLVDSLLNNDNEISDYTNSIVR